MDAIDNIVIPRKLSATDHAIITCDRNEVITSWDERAELTFGWSAKEACGQKIMYLLLPPAPDSLPGLTLHDILSTSLDDQSEQFNITKKVQHKDGSSFDAHILIFKIAGVDSIIVLARNLAKQQRLLDKINISYHHQAILDAIFNIAIKPIGLSTQFEQVLDYLFTIPDLKLLPQAAIFLAEENSNKFTLKARRGFEDQKSLHCRTMPQGMCPCGQSAQYEPFKLPSCTKAKSYKTCKYSEAHGHFCSPIKKGDKIKGVLCLYTQKGCSYGPETEQLVSSICNILAGMVENKEMDIQLVNLVHNLRNSINEIREEKKFSESIIQGLTHGLIVTDLEGNISTYNGVAETIMSAFTPTLAGTNLIDIIGAEAAAKLLALNTASGGEGEQEIVISSAAGDTSILGYSVVAREDALGKQVGRIISISDLTELKYVRKEMEKMNRLATVAEIASAVAHEVRNPLAGIKIMAQSIEGQSVSQEEQSECLTRIIRQVDRLNGLLTEFFSYARPAEPQPRATSLHDIIRDTQPLIANKMVKNHILFKENYGDNIPDIFADPNQVQQVLLNLFLNAMDAIQQGGMIKLSTILLKGRELTKHRKQQPGQLKRSSYVCLSVSDNGGGMPPDTEEKVFEPFFTTKSTGTGLGLSIVYRTLKENNAVIAVTSKLKKGTTFTIYFATEE